MILHRVYIYTYFFFLYPSYFLILGSTSSIPHGYLFFLAHEPTSSATWMIFVRSSYTRLTTLCDGYWFYGAAGAIENFTKRRGARGPVHVLARELITRENNIIERIIGQESETPLSAGPLITSLFHVNVLHDINYLGGWPIGQIQRETTVLSFPFFLFSPFFFFFFFFQFF